MNRFHHVPLAFVLSLLLPLSACAAPLSSGPIDGQVLEEGTHKPIPGAIVVLRWQGASAGSYVDTHTMCYHVETATTNEQGRFHIAAWKTTEEAIGLHSTWYQHLFMGSMVHDREVMKTAYHPGYTFATIPSEKDTVWLKPFVGSRGERFKYLERIKQSTVACTSPAADGKNLVPLYQAIYKETKPLAETNDEQSIADGFLSWIDILEHGVKESEKTTTDRTKKRDRQP